MVTEIKEPCTNHCDTNTSVTEMTDNTPQLQQGLIINSVSTLKNAGHSPCLRDVSRKTRNLR